MSTYLSGFNINPNCVKAKPSKNYSENYSINLYTSNGGSDDGILIGMNDVGYGESSSTNYYNGVPLTNILYTETKWLIYRNVGGVVNCSKANNGAELIEICKSYFGGTYDVGGAIETLRSNNVLVMNYNLPDFATLALMAGFISSFTPCFSQYFLSNFVYAFAGNYDTLGQYFFTRDSSAIALDSSASIIFDGTLSLGLNQQYSPSGNGHFSINTWFKCSSYDVTYGIVSWGNGQVQLLIDANSIAIVVGGNVIQTDAILVNGNWVNVQVAYNGNNIYIWIDGVFRAYGSATPNVVDKEVYVGCMWDGISQSNFFIGVMKTMMLYNESLDGDDAFWTYTNLLPLIDP